MKLFYRVEHFWPASWFMLSGHHDTLESAREYLAAQLLVGKAIRKEKPWTPKTKYQSQTTSAPSTGPRKENSLSCWYAPRDPRDPWRSKLAKRESRILRRKIRRQQKDVIHLFWHYMGMVDEYDISAIRGDIIARSALGISMSAQRYAEAEQRRRP